MRRWTAVVVLVTAASPARADTVPDGRLVAATAEVAPFGGPAGMVALGVEAHPLRHAFVAAKVGRSLAPGHPLVSLMVGARIPLERAMTPTSTETRWSGAVTLVPAIGVSQGYYRLIDPESCRVATGSCDPTLATGAPQFGRWLDLEIGIETPRWGLASLRLSTGVSVHLDPVHERPPYDVPLLPYDRVTLVLAIP
jgi:hypothetical protein